MKAIQTKYLGPTNTKLSRVKAFVDGNSVVLSWDYSIGCEANHIAAAETLRVKQGWTGKFYGKLASGSLPNESGMCHVMTGRG